MHAALCFCFFQLVTSLELATALSQNSSETDLMGKGRRKLMSDELMDEIKAAYNLKESANPPMQFLSPKDMKLRANGVTYSLSGLERVPILSDDAEIMIDGRKIEPTSSLWQGTVGGASVFMRKNSKGNTEYVNIKRDSQSTSFVALDSDGEENIVVEVQEEDADKEILKQYHSKVKEVTGGGNREVLEIKRNNWRAKMDGNHRDLQTCNNKKEIDVAIAFDHTFCDVQGGESKAVAKIETLVGMASKLYGPLCIQLKISAIDGHCRAGSDPYRSMDMTRSGCSGGGLLEDFKDYWNSNSRVRSIKRDVAHIFVGSDFSRERGTIGCAYRAALCNHFAYGANDMRFSSNEDWLANLFAHELGHNCGASHSSIGTIMASSVNDSGKKWASDSSRSISNYVGSMQCVATVGGGGGSGGGGGGNGGDGVDDGDSPAEGDVAKFKNSNQCLTVPAGESIANTALIVAGCNRRSNERQKWTFDGKGPIQLTAGSKFCLQPSKVKNGKPIMLKKCRNNKQQQWISKNDGAIRLVSNNSKCLRNKDGALILGPCTKKAVQSDRKWAIQTV